MNNPFDNLYTGEYTDKGRVRIWNKGVEIPADEEVTRLVMNIIKDNRIRQVGSKSKDFRLLKKKDKFGNVKTYLWLDDVEGGDKKRHRFIVFPMERDTLNELVENYCRYGIITEKFNGFFCIINNYGEITKINQLGLSLIGYEERELLGKPFQTILSSPKDFTQLQNMIDSTKGTNSLELCLIKKTGEKIIGLTYPIQVRDERDDIIYTSLIISDITYQIDELNNSIKNSLELLDSNEYLKKTQTTLIRTEKMAAVGELGAGLAHEINNPLSYLMNNMIMYTEYTTQIIRFIKQLSLDSPLDEESIREEYQKLDLDFITGEMSLMSDEMEEGLEHIQKIVHSLKSFSGNERAKGWNYENINRAIEEMLIISKNRYKYDTTVITELADIPSILCNLSELNQALLAIFNNSVQAVQEKERSSMGKIIIRTELDDTEENLLIHFENDGEPLSDEMKAKVFEPFYSNWKLVQGSGMGLTVAQDIIMGLHKGDIQISTVDDKTRFTILIPITEDIKEGA